MYEMTYTFTIKSLRSVKVNTFEKSTTTQVIGQKRKNGNIKRGFK